MNDGWYKDLLFLTCALGILFFLFLGARPLFTPDEGRYAEIAREMAVRGDYITPCLNGIKYFEKPALFYWLGAAVIQICGSSVTALRSINAILAMIGCLITYAAARKLYGRTTGLFAAIILATSTLYFVMTNMVSLDLPVTVFISASLYGFLLAALQPDASASRKYLYLAAIAAALAVLTKGLIGIVFPGMIAAAWIVVTSEWRQLKRLPVISAFIIFLCISAPWHILVNHYNPEFFHFYFIEQHFLRYATTDVGHYQPDWFFIPTLIAGFFPWIVFLPQALWASLPRRLKQFKEYKSEIFLILWAVLIFAFFSFSKSKLFPYILPVLPPLAILTAHYLATIKLNARGLITGYITFFLSSCIISYLLCTLSITLYHPAYAMMYLHTSAAILTIGSLITLILSFKTSRFTVYGMMITAALFLTISLGAVRYVDTRTILPLANTLKPLLKPESEVITYNQYFQDLPFYLERRITILNWRNELEFGMRHQDTREWMIGNKQFFDKWSGKNQIFMIISKDEFKKFRASYPNEPIIILSETPYNLLVSNRY